MLALYYIIRRQRPLLALQLQYLHNKYRTAVLRRHNIDAAFCML